MTTSLASPNTYTSTTTPKTRHPRPTDPLPRLAVPTVILAATGIGLYVLATMLVLSRTPWGWFAVPLGSVGSYMLFTVGHEATHKSISTSRAFNGALGRLCWLFVSTVSSLPAWNHIHLAHHRHTNNPDEDPDMFATHGKGWTLAVKWTFTDVYYAVWYARRIPARLRRRSRGVVAELVETGAMITFTVTLFAVSVVTGHVMDFVLLILLPQRGGQLLLAFLFDWLPHSGLVDTPSTNRYRTTRIRVGLEKIVSPLMMWQNYHFIHHLHPWSPFYRNVQVWRKFSAQYLALGVEVTTLGGAPVANPPKYPGTGSG